MVDWRPVILAGIRSVGRHSAFLANIRLSISSGVAMLDGVRSQMWGY